MTDTTFEARDYAAPPPASEKLSELLTDLAGQDRPKMSLRDLAIAMEDRSFGAFLVVFALPNLIPLPPGATFFLGLPLVYLAFQMTFSRLPRVSLPPKLANYAMETATFSLVVARITPWLQRVERLVRPRFWMIESRIAERAVGALCLILAIVVFLPITLGNWAPAFAIAVIGLAHSQRDGIVLAIGCGLGLLSLVVVAGVIAAAGALVAAFL